MPYEKLTQLKSKLIIGTKQTVKAISQGKISEVFIAEDAEEHIKTKVVEVATKQKTEITFVDSKKKLGEACQIDVDASTVAIKNEG